MANEKLYTCREADLFAELTASRDGLTAEVAAQRLTEVGPNPVSAKHRHSFFVDILIRCRNPLVILLFIIGAVSLATGDEISAAIVGGMVVLSVFLVVLSGSAVDASGRKVAEDGQDQTIVIRDGKEVEVPMEQIVAGRCGVARGRDSYPRICGFSQPKTFSSPSRRLTGESMPVEKNFAPCSLAARASSS